MSEDTKEQLENMLEDVVNELELSDDVIAEHGPIGTPPAELVRLVLTQKDREIRNLKSGIIKIEPKQCPGCRAMDVTVKELEKENKRLKRRLANRVLK